MAAAEAEVMHCSTDDFEYTVRISMHQEQRLTVSEPCVLVDAFFVDESCLRIPCYGCSGFSDYGEFILYYKQQVFDMLHSCYPSLNVRSLHEVDEYFAEFIAEVDDEHPCPRYNMKIVERIIVFEIIDLILDDEDGYLIDDEENRVVMESFEEVEPVKRPATREYVEALIEDGKRFDLDSNNVDRECVICMDKIERGESLSMPCLHVFHEACIVKWLSNSHVCPLCRYELPYEDHHDFWSPE